MKYKIGKHYEPMHYAPHNIETWDKLKPLFDKGAVEYRALVIAAHGHKGGARGFVDYLIKHEWIK